MSQLSSTKQMAYSADAVYSLQNVAKKFYTALWIVMLPPSAS